MKKNILYLFCFFCGFAKAQSLYYDKYFKLGGVTEATEDIITLNDSTYIIRSITTTTAGNEWGYLKLDKYGNEIYKNTFNYLNAVFYIPQKSFNSYVKISESSSLFFCGNTYKSPVNLIFSKIRNSTLDTVKNFYYNDNYYYYPGSIIKLNSNKYLYYASKTNTTTGNYYPHHFILDSSMNYIGSTTYNYTNNIGAYSAIINPINKRLILVGQVLTGSVTNGGLIEADTLGNVYNSYLNNLGNNDNAFAQVFYSAFDNTYVTIGAKKTGKWGNLNLYRLYMCKFNSTTLQPIWRKTYGQAQYINGLWDAVIKPDGSIVACGLYADSVPNVFMNANPNGVILKVKANGDSLWMRQYDNYLKQPPSTPMEEILEGIEPTSNGGYIAVGMPYQKPDAKVWVLQVDSMGCFNVNCTPSSAGVTEVDGSVNFSFYPNPANNKFEINCENNEITSISIEDINGKMMFTNKINIGKTIIETNHLSNGIYFIRFLAGYRVLATKKIIVIKE